MPSKQILEFNQHARENLKAAMNADYDPVARRSSRTVQNSLEADSAFEQVGRARLEWRHSSGRERVVAYVSGGGFCFDADDRHRMFIDEIAAAVGADACIVRYRLAPEHPYPAAFDDVADALEHLLASAVRSSVDILGDSAGGALILSAVMERVAAGRALPHRMVLLSPLTDMAMTGASNIYNAEADPLFGPQAVIHKTRHYLQGANPTEPRASPLWGNPAGLPPVLCFAGSTEVMLDDSVRFVAKAKDAGVEARISIVEEAPHTFPLMPDFPETNVARAQIVEFLRL